MAKRFRAWLFSQSLESLDGSGASRTGEFCVEGLSFTASGSNARAAYNEGCHLEVHG